ncbi:MAG: GNAT family N-acetyltransferase [Chitinophagaceae bacterium]|nr:GNAT family N-acetyltransferase [Chitinophagaceae bacterium]
MMQEYIIRRSSKNDAGALSKLICENAAVLLLPYYNDEQMDAFVKFYSATEMQAKVATQNIFCATLDNEIVGCIALDKNQVVGFYTSLQFQKRGIGKLLLEFIEKFAQSQGINELQLYAPPQALAYYLRHGWLKIKEVTCYYFSIGFEETLMKKEIGW